MTGITRMPQADRLGRILTVLAALVVSLAAVGNAEANTKRVSDANDRPGRLDIRSATHGHAGARVAHTISTFSRWRAGLLGVRSGNLFSLGISTDGDRADERVVLVYSQRSRMRAGVFRVSGRRLVFLGSASASKPNARTARVVIALADLGRPAAYRWRAQSQFRAAGACSDFCIDRTPNSARVLHDVKAPAVALALPAFPNIPADVEYDVSYTVSPDTGGAGLRSWMLQHRLLGTSSWTTVASGTRSGSRIHHHVSAEGNQDQFRIVAVDRHGNIGTRTRLVSVPVDDGALAYTGTWAVGGTADDFGGTVHTASPLGSSATATYGFTGRYIGVVARGGGFACFGFDGEIGMCVDMGDIVGPRKIVFERGFSTLGPHTMEIVVESSNTFDLDGVLVRDSWPYD